ncbi:MAG: hypothetical protein Q8N63_03680 [Nanoarchaeota archaeon]|nr:hypothetical protein [Nanoarchaeota archaeon]
MTNTQKAKEQDAFVRPTDRVDLKDYFKETKELQQLPYHNKEDQIAWEQAAKADPIYRQSRYLLHKLKRTTEQGAVGMTYVGSLDKVIELTDSEMSWTYEGSGELRRVFLDKLAALSNRPTPTHFSLNVHLEEKRGNFYERYRAFANFYRDSTAEGGEK